MLNYLAIIGDLKGSRHITERAAAQQTIQQTLTEINSAYAPLFASKLTLTLGDEFQCLIDPHQPGLFQMLDDLETRLLPYAFRSGLGFGTISTAINPELSIGADGEAYWHARRSIDYVHAHAMGGKVRTHIIGFSNDLDDLFNGLLEATDTIKYSWTTRQDETFRQLIQHGIYSDSFEQKQFAKSINISQSSLTKRLNAGNIKLYLKLRNTVEMSIRRYYAHAE